MSRIQGQSGIDRNCPSKESKVVVNVEEQHSVFRPIISYYRYRRLPDMHRSWQTFVGIVQWGCTKERTKKQLQ